MNAELVYVDACLPHPALPPRLRELGEDRVDVELESVASPEVAEAERSLGSPTVRVNGENVDSGAGGEVDYAMQCRLYRTDAGQAPPDAWIRRALEGET